MSSAASIDSENATARGLKVLATGIAMGESPRWHEGRLWFCDWGAQQILSVDLEGNQRVEVEVPFVLPFCIDWLPDGRQLIVAGREGRVVRREADGTLATHADLSAIAPSGWNEIVVDGRGNAYVNCAAAIALIAPDGTVRKVADGGAFPNGMAITTDGATLIMAESHGRRLTGFDIAGDGSLGNRRTWADLGDGVPDGICLDAEGAVWYADVPNRCCVRVCQGGEVMETITLDRGGFSCALGGAENKTLFITANEWRGMEQMAEVAAARTGQIVVAEVLAPGFHEPPQLDKGELC
jgi:sugar lactone lactonase YvrE